MFETLLVAGAAMVVATMVAVYRSTRDVLHPAMILGPMLLAMYAWLPARLWLEGSLFDFTSREELEFVHLVNVVGMGVLLLGIAVGARRWRQPGASVQLSTAAWRRLRWGALAAGTVGLATYAQGVLAAGGLAGAYGQHYGGGSLESGYARDAVLLGVVGLAILLADARPGHDRLWVWPTCIAFAAPFLVHGLLGARRGPLFLVASVMASAWYLARRRRPASVLYVAGGIALGLLLLVLVSNRGTIFLGRWEIKESPFRYVEAGAGNEYIYGAGAVIDAWARERFYWGYRYLVILVVRPVPRAWWPDKYADVGLPEIEENLGLGRGEFVGTMGWAGAAGAAPGVIADLWVELAWAFVVPLFAIGWIYGRAWRRARRGDPGRVVVYSLLVGVSLYLVAQTLEAALVRSLEMLGAALAIWWWARRAGATAGAGERAMATLPGPRSSPAAATPAAGRG